MRTHFLSAAALVATLALSTLAEPPRRPTACDRRRDGRRLRVCDEAGAAFGAWASSRSAWARRRTSPSSSQERGQWPARARPRGRLLPRAHSLRGRRRRIRPRQRGTGTKPSAPTRSSSRRARATRLPSTIASPCGARRAHPRYASVNHASDTNTWLTVYVPVLYIHFRRLGRGHSLS